MRIGLGKHVAERKNEVVQVPMIVDLALILIKRGIRALRISVQNPDHPLTTIMTTMGGQDTQDNGQAPLQDKYRTSIGQV